MPNSTHLVLGLDEVDRVFQYPNLADDFFALLRAFHEEAKTNEVWKKLRLVVVHSTEALIALNIYQSPFNVGLPIELPEFTAAQIKELAHRHGLSWSDGEIRQLMSLVGGHPYLTRVTMYNIVQHSLTLTEVLESATRENNLFSDHLRRHLFNLEQQSALAIAYKKILSEESSLRLESNIMFKLHSMGLIRLEGDKITPRSQLYRQYFAQRLA